MRVFYREEMIAESGSYSPSAAKPKAVVEDWRAHGLSIEICDFSAATHEDLCLAHAPSYVEGIFSGRVVNGHGNTSRKLAESTLWTVGSLIAAANDALDSGLACSPTSGFHHASFTSAGGFCTFNGLMVVAIQLLSAGKLKRVGVLDCDWHYGNGTDDIIRQFRLSGSVVHCTSGREHFHGKAPRYFQWLERSLQAMWQSDVELVLYQAGADAHVDDPLGGLLDDDELARRDEIVFDYCHAKSLPVAWCLAGGYQRDALGSIEPVLRVHRRTAESAIRTCSSL